MPAKGRKVFGEWNEGDGGNFVCEGLTRREVHPLLRQFVIFEKLVIRNEIHRFPRWSNWLRADEAAEHFSVDATGVKTATQLCGERTVIGTVVWLSPRV